MSVELGAILTAVVTPFDAQGRVDEEACRAADEPPRRARLGRARRSAVRPGEAATLDRRRAPGVIGLAVTEMRAMHDRRRRGLQRHSPRRQADRARDRARPDALLSVNPYYNRPGRARADPPLRGGRSRDRPPDPALQHPQRTGQDLPNELLAELAQLEHIVGVKQANPDNLAKVDGLQIYAGNDDMLAECSTSASQAASARAVTFRRSSAGWSTSPSSRREIERRSKDVYRDMAIAPAACTNKTALNLIGVPVGRAPAAVRRARRVRDGSHPRDARAPGCSRRLREYASE